MLIGRGRAVRGVAALAVSCAVLAGCGSGPSEADSAAIVGGTAIPLAEIQSQLTAALAKPDVTALISQRGLKDSDVSRELVARNVRHVLLEEAARRDGISISDSQVSSYLASDAGKAAASADVLSDAATERARAKDRLIAIELARRELDKLSVTVDLIQADSRATAEATAREVAKGGASAEAVFARAGAQRAQQIPAAEAGALAASALFGTPAGNVLAFQPSQGQGGWAVVRITDRQLAGSSASSGPSSGPSASPSTSPEAQSSTPTDDDSLQVIGERLVQPLADDLGVWVNPRYGVWDPVLMTVSTPENSGGLILPISGAA